MEQKWVFKKFKKYFLIWYTTSNMHWSTYIYHSRAKYFLFMHGIIQFLPKPQLAAIVCMLKKENKRFQ